jgi:hypothetical protein
MPPAKETIEVDEEDDIKKSLILVKCKKKHEKKH